MTKEELQKQIKEAQEFIRSKDNSQEDKDKKVNELKELTRSFKQTQGLKDLFDELDELEDDDKEDRSKKFPQQGDKRTKVNEDKNPLKEMRSAINDYLHSGGTIRSDKLQFTEGKDKDLIIPKELTRDALDGIKSADVNPTIPTSISYIPQDEVKTVVDLGRFVNHKSVTTATGSYPIRKKATAKLNTVAELEKNPELAKPNFTEISYKVQTRRGAEPVSQESIDDSAVDLIPFLVNDANEQKINTTNADIAAIFESFKPLTVKTLDDIKHINNVDLDQAYNRSIVATGSFYQWLDTLKDGNGRYLLQTDVKSASGTSIFGIPVFKIDDGLFGVKGDAHAFIGDLNRAIFYADRAQITARWVDDTVYGQYLQVGTRYDIVKADENAGYFLTVDTKTATAADTSNVGK
ncbi:phage major capsid protein [Companilactobacillus nuruki]|uniref:Phage major capsid protein n=1 Tax=Companilactobacillus nuruki TaxID=1993540 RepID=A0A2N7AV55_9LACO|nr:phage major capsid protein [Companilactobacillus nuruki]PMD71498.1 phage major capsid protein [Companilactobacillus nuruki]